MRNVVETIKIIVGAVTGFVKIGGRNLLVMGGRMMLGEVVGLVEASFLPEDMKLSLVNAVADPEKLHVNCLGSLLFDGVIGDACSGAVVHLDGHWGLLMVQFDESCWEGAGFFAIMEDGGKFSLGSAGNDFT